MHVKGQKGRERETESQSDKPDRLKAKPDSERKILHSLIFVLFSPQLGQTVSNNCEHLGNLQAQHPNPRGSSPGTGGPM